MTDKHQTTQEPIQDQWLQSLTEYCRMDTSVNQEQLEKAKVIMKKGQMFFSLNSGVQHQTIEKHELNEKQKQRATAIMQKGQALFSQNNITRCDDVVSLCDFRSRLKKSDNIMDYGIRAAASDGNRQTGVITIEMEQFTLSIIPYEDEPNTGEIELRVKPNKFKDWEQKTVEVLNSEGNIVLSGKIDNGLLDDADINLSALQQEMGFAVRAHKDEA